MHGAVGVALTGNFTLRTVVSQGCKPIGQPFVITRCEEQVIYELSGQPALTAVREALTALSPEDQNLARTALLMGRVIDEYKEEFSRGDFLIRTFLGADPQSGAIAVGDMFRPGQTVQLVYTFDRAGTLEYACHAAGHYAAGMRGTITVSPS